MTMPEADSLLARASRGLLVVWRGAPGARRVDVQAPAVWWDGLHLWLTGAPEGAAEQPECTVLLADDDGTVVVRGTARTFGTADPLGLLLHGAAITGALGALAARGAFGLSRPGAPALPVRLVTRLTVREARPLSFPCAGQGPTPALPTELPADVRRDLAGVREVVVLGAGASAAVPASWEAGMTLRADPLPAGHVVVALVAGRTSVVLEGELADGRLTPRHARWWRGPDAGQTAVRGDAVAFVLPD